MPRQPIPPPPPSDEEEWYLSSEQPDLSEEEIALAERIHAMTPEEFLHFQWAREDAATEAYLQEKAAKKAAAAHKRRTTRPRRSKKSPATS